MTLALFDYSTPPSISGKLSTAENFVMNQVSADKAYLSGNNLKTVVDAAAMPYIPFKANSVAHDKRHSPLWKQMYHGFAHKVGPHHIMLSASYAGHTPNSGPFGFMCKAHPAGFAHKVSLAQKVNSLHKKSASFSLPLHTRTCTLLQKSK